MKKTPQQTPQEAPQEAPQDAVATVIPTSQGPITLPVASLQAWRTHRNNLSQQRLAERARAAGGSTTLEEDTVRNIEKARTRPALDTALALAQALGVLVEQVQWPSAEDIRANGGSRRSRYQRGEVDTAERLAVGRVVLHPVMGGGGVSLDDSLRLLKERLDALGLEDKEITQSMDRVRQKVAEEEGQRQQELAEQPARRAPRIPTRGAPDAR